MPKTADEIALDLVASVDITTLPRDESERNQRVTELVGTAYALADALFSVKEARQASDPASPEKARKLMGEVFNPNFAFDPSGGGEPK